MGGAVAATVRGVEVAPDACASEHNGEAMAMRTCNMVVWIKNRSRATRPVTPSDRPTGLPFGASTIPPVRARLLDTVVSVLVLPLAPLLEPIREFASHRYGHVRIARS